MNNIFKKIIGLSIFSLSIPLLCFGQRFRSNDCGTKSPTTPIVVPNAEQMQRNMVPYMMKIFVHIIADDNGANQACLDTSILRQLENMREFYEPHQICFQLLGMQVINDTDLNDHGTSEEGELLPYLVGSAMNIFIHNELHDGLETLNGSAYDIPNTYLSLSRNAVISMANRSTLAHEMGHCFGLYHTFEVNYGEEEVPRSGDCKNCTEAGDLLCDTEADPHSDGYDTGDFINNICEYTGLLERECDDISYSYNMDPHNIMAYGRRECRDLFTINQGARMDAIITSTSILQNRVSPSSLTVSLNSTISSGTFAYGAENTLTLQGNTYTVTGTANGYYNAAEVLIKPNVHFKPSNGGLCLVTAENPTCD